MERKEQKNGEMFNCGFFKICVLGEEVRKRACDCHYAERNIGVRNDLSVIQPSRTTIMLL